jgi:predicted RNA methylase
VGIKATERESYTIGAGGMLKSNTTFLVAFEGRTTELCEHIAAPMIARALGHPPLSEEAAHEYHLTAKAKEAIRRAEQTAQSDKAALISKANDERFHARRPNWAQAVIVAKFMNDESDSMSDYWNSKPSRCVVLGYSSHKRDLFPEMRKAAALFPETAHLATAPESAEHREKYSMGGGYYLKDGGRHSTGWKVEKTSYFSGLAPWGSELEFLPEQVAPVAPPSVNQPAPLANQPEGRFAIEKHTHTTKGFDMWICTMAERVERAEYDELLSKARAVGGWYSRAWNGTPAGFAFKQEAKALAFVGTPCPNQPPPSGDKAKAESPEPKPAPAASVDKSEATAQKLEAMAEGLDSSIADAYRDRRANTPKQAKQATQARQQGAQWERGQKLLRALASCYRAGTVPPLLAGIVSKKALLELSEEGFDYSRAGYYDAGFATGKPAQWYEQSQRDQAAALWALLDKPHDPEAQKAEALRVKLQALKFANIPGYFPTPAPIVARMIEAADLAPGSFVLEPSAGSGAIANALRELGHNVACIERQRSLVEVLELQGHIVNDGGDFLEHKTPWDDSEKVDAVLMNPPFENGQDMAHVVHAFDFVKSGGTLVAIMGAGVTFKSDKKTQAFRAWVDDLAGEIVALPDGSFKESGTGVSTVMLTIKA